MIFLILLEKQKLYRYKQKVNLKDLQQIIYELNEQTLKI